MEIVVVKNKFERLLSSLLRFVPSRPSLPVLSSILLTAADDNSFLLKATDLEMGIEIGFGAKVIKKGSVLVDGRVLNDVVKGMVGDKIIIKKEDGRIFVGSQGQKVEVLIEDPTEYPIFKMPDKEGAEKMTTGEVKDFLRKTAFSVSKDEIRPVLTGLMMKAGDKDVEIVSTDGVRLSVLRKKGLKWSGKKVVPVRFWSEVGNLSSDQVEIWLNDKKKQIAAESEIEDGGRVRIVSQLIEGDYPKYETIIPEKTQMNVTVNRGLLDQRLGLVMVLAREGGNVVKLRVEKGKLLLSAQASVRGNVEVELEAEVQPDSSRIELAINGKFLQDVVGVIEDEYVSLGIEDKLKPVLIRGVEKDDYLHVLMPVNLSE
ncbi:MAG: DNA polymerase III subunit beta [bacterium]|nr:DNA polymerase III subunit beta [bacterium]